jgi:hypothetical protein
MVGLPKDILSKGTEVDRPWLLTDDADTETPKMGGPDSDDKGSAKSETELDNTQAVPRLTE